jgi:hypothetical protein
MVIPTAPDPRVFQTIVKKHMAETRTVREAYERAEEYCEKNFGRRKYSDYDSYRKVRQRLRDK